MQIARPRAYNSNVARKCCWAGDYWYLLSVDLHVFQLTDYWCVAASLLSQNVQLAHILTTSCQVGLRSRWKLGHMVAACKRRFLPCNATAGKMNPLTPLIYCTHIPGGLMGRREGLDYCSSKACQTGLSLMAKGTAC
ncbi:hypothetical protein V6N12_070852 [Hibiscus sabdariffa]|uniref:Uncharacterized protein n=1 Tax=Hibiscus sabdariffa TaxID=183260 RepID=A0ABR2FI26_9ROSI